jgi:hypothetical protein
MKRITGKMRRGERWKRGFPEASSRLFCVFMVLLSEKEVFLRSGRVLCQLTLKEHELVGVADGIQVLDMMVGDIEHRYELQA